MTIAVVDFTNYAETTAKSLDAMGAREILAKQSAVLIKPNLVTTAPHPVTTHPEACAAVIDYVREACEADIVIAEGTGDAEMETSGVFSRLGYDAVAAEYGIALIDLNQSPLVKLNNSDCPFFPKIAFSHFIVSLPVLKAHSLSVITGTLKNMMGFAPPQYYSGPPGIWKKAIFHKNVHQAVRDLNMYRTPDLTVLDASVGLAEYHLGGAPCDPPINKMVAGTDPVAVDRLAAELLNLDWRDIPHLR